MPFYVCLVPVCHVRAEASHRSEQVTQLLFGEMCEVTEMKDDFGIQVYGSKGGARLFSEQYKGKEALLQSNVKALRLGHDYATEHLGGPIGLRVARANNVGNKIFVDGNSAAALGAVYGGASVCAWYPITPS